MLRRGLTYLLLGGVLTAGLVVAAGCGEDQGSRPLHVTARLESIDDVEDCLAQSAEFVVTTPALIEGYGALAKCALALGLPAPMDVAGTKELEQFCSAYGIDKDAPAAVFGDANYSRGNGWELSWAFAVSTTNSRIAAAKLTGGQTDYQMAHVPPNLLFISKDGGLLNETVMRARQAGLKPEDLDTGEEGLWSGVMFPGRLREAVRKWGKEAENSLLQTMTLTLLTAVNETEGMAVRIDGEGENYNLRVGWRTEKQPALERFLGMSGNQVSAILPSDAIFQVRLPVNQVTQPLLAVRLSDAAALLDSPGGNDGPAQLLSLFSGDVSLGLLAGENQFGRFLFAVEVQDPEMADAFVRSYIPAFPDGQDAPELEDTDVYVGNVLGPVFCYIAQKHMVITNDADAAKLAHEALNAGGEGDSVRTLMRVDVPVVTAQYVPLLPKSFVKSFSQWPGAISTFEMRTEKTEDEGAVAILVKAEE